MGFKKRKAAATGRDETRPPPRHRYPTRHKLLYDTISLFSVYQAARVDYRDKDKRCSTYLPREIIFKILLFIPAQVLHEVLRYICKEWYDIVCDPHFIRAHTQMASAGFLIQEPRDISEAYYIEADNTRLKVTEVQIPFPAVILGSSHGLVLLHDMTDQNKFHLMNLMTKAKLSLPPVAGLPKYNTMSAGFAFTPSGHCKVVLVFGKMLPNKIHPDQIQMRVFTVGVDKAWRFVELDGITMNETVVNTMLFPPCVIAGLMYWYSTSFCCFAMDIDNETIYRFSGPKDDVRTSRKYCFISMGTHLGLMKGELDGSWTLWKLTHTKSNEWTYLGDIHIEAEISRFNETICPSKRGTFLPVRLVDGDIWFYNRADQGFVVVRYNLTNRSFVFFPMKVVIHFDFLHPHVHTLLSPENL